MSCFGVSVFGAVCVHAKSLRPCLTFCDAMDCSPPVSSIYGILQPRIMSGLPYPSPGDLPHPWIEPITLKSPALAGVFFTTSAILGFSEGLVDKESPCSAGDTGEVCSTPGSGRSPGVGNGKPLWYSCLKNPMDRRPWRDTAQRVAKSWR